MLCRTDDATDQAQREHMDERAAILEFEAGWPRAIAESEARRWAAQQRWIQGVREMTGWVMPATPTDGSL